MSAMAATNESRRRIKYGVAVPDHVPEKMNAKWSRFIYFYRLYPGNARKAAAFAGYADPSEAAGRLLKEPTIKRLLEAGLADDLADDPDLPKKTLGRVAAIALRPDENMVTLKACDMLLKHFRIIMGQERTGGDQILNMFTSPEQAREILERLPARMGAKEILARDTIAALPEPGETAEVITVGSSKEEVLMRDDD